MKKTILIALAAITLVIMAGCQMDVAEAVAVIPLVEPYITTQPESKTFAAGANAAVTLSVEVAEWNSGDGTLSYQWYTFNTIAEYITQGGEGTPIPGATGPQYAPASLKNAAGDKNYFYVKVTNTNNAATIGGNSATIQSDAAIISFYPAGATPPPLITRQPRNVSARFGRSINPLAVRVQNVAAPGELEYQWYQVRFDNEGKLILGGDGFPAADRLIAEEIETDPTTWADPDVPEYEIRYETNPEYQPAPGAVPIGDHYFYVEVTHKGAGTGNAVEISVPAIVKIDLGLRAEAPVITEQPKAALYFPGDTTIASLTVEADSPDFGELSYQWFRQPSTVNSNTGGTLIDGATNKSYAPNLDANANSFYYVVVTNTNQNVIGEKIANASSRAVNVRRTNAASVASPNSTIQIGSLTDTNNRFNYVRGYGGMEVAWANFPETFPADTELMYNPDRLGYNMLRIMMPVSNVNIDLAMDDLVNVTKRRPHYYDNVKIVNKYGGYVAAAPWSPPKEWKSNNSINGGGILRHQYFQQYADYLKAFSQHMYNRGAPIYCISIQNEPNYTAGYDGCEWTGNEMRDFFKAVGTFTQGVKGWGGGRQIPRVLTMNGESANHVNINYPAIDDSAAYNSIDVFARHVYGERRQNMWTGRPDVQQRDGKEVWMTEHNINSANAAGYVLDSKWDYIWRFMNDIDLVMRLNNENAFVWWASKRFYSMVGDGQYGTPAGVALPRGWGLSHYAKYTIDMTRIGFTMTGHAVTNNAEINYTADADNNPVINGWGIGENTDMDNTTARITAYVSRDGTELSMVMWTPTLTSGSGGFDLGTIEIKMPAGFAIGSATAIQSYLPPPPGPNVEPEPVFQEPFEVDVSSDRLTAYVNLPRSRIVSVKFTRQ